MLYLDDHRRKRDATVDEKHTSLRSKFEDHIQSRQQGGNQTDDNDNSSSTDDSVFLDLKKELVTVQEEKVQAMKEDMELQKEYVYLRHDYKGG